MAEKTLNAYVVLGGKIDNSFSQLGQGLINLGGHIDGISQKLINFGKESVQTYRSYEDSMLEAQVALSTSYGRGTKELNEVMTSLDRQASEWAATTIFHTDDVANAIAEAAHANWDLDKIMKGMPAAMRLAQAGGLDLSTGLDYIIKSTNAAGIGFEELESWVDEWTYAANSSAGDVEQFGDAMMRMGATMKFAENKEELLTLLAVLHDAGATGSEAGTLLRNSMIRLIAPTKKAKDAMAELGLTDADISEAMAEVEGDTAGAVAKLEELGFSVYDNNGKLKDFTTIFEDLSAATKGLNEQEKYDIWSSIFPTRTITGAMALIEGADKNWNGLLDDLRKGKAAGYGKYAAETMMSGLTGSIETFNSKMEDLRKELGQQLAPQLETITGNLGKLIDMIRSGGRNNGVSSGLDWITGLSNIVGNLAENMGEMDPALFDALVSGLGSIAALGPMLTIGGLAIRGIGSAMSVFTGSIVGKVILAAAAMSVIGQSLGKLYEAKFLEKFGSLEIDTTNLDASMTRIRDAFDIATEPTNKFAQALSDSVANYNAASQTFSSTMLEDLLSNQTLTGKELENKLAEYKELGGKMVGALKDGITASADTSAEFWASIFRGKSGQSNEQIAQNPIFAGIIQTIESEKDAAVSRAEKIGNDLQKAISQAWGDGNLSEEEREKIKEYFRQLNEAMAEAELEAQKESDYIKRRQMMDAAQGMSYEQMQEYVDKTIAPQRQEELDWYDNHFKGEIFRWEYKRNEAQEKYNELMSQGRFDEAREYGKLITQYDQSIAGGKEQYEKFRASIYSEYDNLIMDWFAATLADSTMFGDMPGSGAEGMNVLQQAAEWFMSGMESNPFTLFDYINNNLKNVGSLQDYYERELKALGGVDEIQKRIAVYNESGDEAQIAMAKNLEQVLAIYSILNPDSKYFSAATKELTAADLESMYRGGLFGESAGTYLKQLLDLDFDSEYYQGRLNELSGVSRGMISGLAELFGQVYNVDMINALFGQGRELYPELRDDFATAILLGMSEEQRKRYALGSAESDLWNAEEDARQKRAKADAAVEGFYNSPAGQVFFGEYNLPEDIQALVQEAEQAEALAAGMKEAADGANEFAEAAGNAAANLPTAGPEPINPPEQEGLYAGTDEGLAAEEKQIPEAGTAGTFGPVSMAEAAETWMGRVRQDLGEAQAARDTAQQAYRNQQRLSSGLDFSEEAGGKTQELKANLDLAEQAEAEAQAAYDEVAAIFDTPIDGSTDVHGEEAGQAARSSIESKFATPIYGRIELTTFSGLDGITGITKMAKGGRETRPTIFAEAGIPEWYIPEEHTPNTAQLIAAAANNSGFSLIEIAAMSGARLFADGGTDGNGDTGATLEWGELSGGETVNNGGDISVQYSPVIHSGGESGVERKLKEDKARFKKFFEEFMAERELYQSMAAY